MSARTQFICLIGSIKLFKNFSICYFFSIALISSASLSPNCRPCPFSDPIAHVPEDRTTLRPTSTKRNDL
jgi:hypothetical protein